MDPRQGPHPRSALGVGLTVRLARRGDGGAPHTGHCFAGLRCAARGPPGRHAHPPSVPRREHHVGRRSRCSGAGSRRAGPIVIRDRSGRCRARRGATCPFGQDVLAAAGQWSLVPRRARRGMLRIRTADRARLTRHILGRLEALGLWLVTARWRRARRSPVRYGRRVALYGRSVLRAWGARLGFGHTRAVPARLAGKTAGSYSGARHARVVQVAAASRLSMIGSWCAGAGGVVA